MVKRSILVLSATALVVAAIAAYVVLYLTNVPGSAQAAQTSAGNNSLYLATVATAEASDPHPTWVSYYVTDSHAQNWRHDTTFVVHAHSLVHVTIFQFDGDSGLRNSFLTQVQGTVGGAMQLNGKTVQTIVPDNAAHIFAIPELGVSVPLEGVASDAKNACAQAPCSITGNAYNRITFTFRTQGKGLFRWQCFVPCGAGTVFDFGGPMQTVGYMDGFVKVV